MLPLQYLTIKTQLNTQSQYFRTCLVYTQFQKNWHSLVPFGIANASSTVGNTRPVSTWYCHDMILTVLCLSSIITILILAIFIKTKILSSKTVSTCKRWKVDWRFATPVDAAVPPCTWPCDVRTSPCRRPTFPSSCCSSLKRKVSTILTDGDDD